MRKIFVTYELAEKLKVIGFNESCIFSYDKDKQPRHNLFYSEGLLSLDWSKDSPNLLAPLWEQVATWLRNEYQITVIVGFSLKLKKWDAHSSDLKLYGIEYIKQYMWKELYDQPKFDTYEEALEYGITECINKIWKKYTYIPDPTSNTSDITKSKMFEFIKKSTPDLVSVIDMKLIGFGENSEEINSHYLIKCIVDGIDFTNPFENRDLQSIERTCRVDALTFQNWLKNELTIKWI